MPITFTPEPGSISPPLDLLTKDVLPNARQLYDAQNPDPFAEFEKVEPAFQDAGGAKQIDLNARAKLGGFKDPFAEFQKADPFQGFERADDLDVKSVEDLDKDRENFRPVDYFTNNPDVAKDPKKLAKLLEIYRRRDEEGLTAKGVASAAIKNTPGLVGDIAGGIKRLGERAIDVAIQPTANVVLGALTGDLFDDQKRAALFNETRKTIKKGVSEVSAGSEAATVGLVDLARTADQKVSRGAITSFDDLPRTRVSRPEPIPSKPKTDQQLLAQLSDDASFRQVADAAMKGEGEAAKNFGLDKETLAKQGIELDEKAIQQLSLVDPVTMVATGGAFKLVGVGGKVLGAAKTLEGAQHLADGLAKAAKWSVGKGIQYSGTATKAVGKVLQGSGRTASLITGIGAATRGAGPIEAIAIAGATKMVGPTVRKVGALAEHFGKSITGEVPVSVAGQKLLDYAKPVIEAGKTVSKGAAEGMVAGSPFAIAAQDDETAGALLGAGAALGAAGGAGAGAFRVVKSSASRRYFGENRPVLEDVPSQAYGFDAALDAQHEANIQKLSAQDASELNNFREALRQQGGEIYAVDQPTFRQKVAEEYRARTGQQIDPALLDTYQNHSAFFDTTNGDRKVVYLNSDTTGLQHDAGHIFDAVLSPEKRAELRTAVESAFTPEQRQAFRDTYERRVGSKISDTAAVDEFIAEQFAALFNNVPVTELNAPKSLLNKFIDVAAEGAEALGIDLSAGATTPNLGAPVSVGIRQLFRNAAGEVTRRGIEAKTAAPTNVSAPDFRGGGGTPQSEGAPTPADPNPPTGGPANAVPLFPSRNTRVTPSEESRLGQPPQSPEAREAAAKRFSETGIDMARAKAKENEGSANSRAIESISDSMESNNPVVQIEHLGVTSKSTPEAPLGDVARSAEQSAAYPKISSEASRVGVPADIISQHSKNFVPVRWFQNKKGKLKLLAMSLDKVITNIKIVSEAGAKNPKIAELIPYPTENGRLTEEGWRQVIADTQSYSENQANGRRGDGKLLKVPEAGLSIPAENPAYTPQPLPPERANFQNLLQGLETPLSSKKGSTGTGLPRNIKGQLLAEANLRPTETPARIEPKRADKQAFLEFPGRTVQEVNPLRNEFERQGFNHRNLLKVTEEINAKDIVSAIPRPDIKYKAPVTDIIQGGFLPGRLDRTADFPPPNEETFYWVSPHGEVFEAGKHVDNLLDFAYEYVTRGYDPDYPLSAMHNKGWESFSIDPAIERFKIDSYHILEPNQMEAIKKWSDALGFRMQDESGTLHDFTKEIAQDRKEKAIASALEPGHFLPAPTEFRQKNLGGRTVEEFSDYVLKAAPTEWKAATENMTGGLTGGAWNLGLGLKDAADVAVLKSFQEKLSVATKEAMSSGDFDAAYSLVSKGQFFREAYEAATGTGSAGAAFKRGQMGTEGVKPPFPTTEKTQATAATGTDATTITIGESGAQFLPAEELVVGTSEQTPELRVLPAAPGGRPPVEPPGFRPPPVAAGFLPAEQLELEEQPDIRVVPAAAAGGTPPIEPPGFRPPPVAAGFLPNKEEENQARTGVEFKKFFSDVAAGKFGKSEVPFTPLQDLSDVATVEAERLKHWGNFENHIQRSIPMLHEEKTRLADGVIKTFGEKGARLLDIGSSEGDFGKAISALTDGKIETVSLDPNPQMAADFKSLSTVKGAIHTEDAFLNGFEDSGKVYPAHNPDEPYDLINEAVTFQFIDPNRDAQVAEVKRMLAPNGIFTTAEKFKTADWAKNEAKKDTDYKNKYFTESELSDKDKRVGFQQSKGEEKSVGMVDNMVSDTAFEDTLKKNFKHVVQYWDSGNFKGYAASDNPEVLARFVKNIGDLNSEFSTVKTPRQVTEAGAFLPRTESGRKLEEKGFEIVPSGELGIRRVTVTKDGNEVAVIQSVSRSPQRAEISMVQKYKGAPRGVGEVLYRELGSQLRDDGVTEVAGNVISPEPLAIRRKVFGDFASLDLNGEPATYEQAIATAERIQNRIENKVAAIEPVNTISEATRFLPKVKRDAQGRPLTKSGDIDYPRWQAEGLAARRKREKEPIAESAPRGAVSKDAGPITGWILPDKKFVSLDTNFHEQYLAENADSLNEKFNTSFSDEASVDDRLNALNAGFVRLRNYNGKLNVEANSSKWTFLKSKVLETLQDREGQIDSLTLSLLNNEGQEVDSASVPRLYDLSGPEKLNAISEAVDSLRSGRFLPWKNFPDAVVHTSIAKLASNEKYAAAKSGNMRAAISVVAPLVKLDLFKPLADQHPEAILVPVIAEELRGRNKLPLALAKILSRETGLEVTTDIVQANRAHHTGATDLERAFRVPKFDGGVTKGAEYILVDDVSTSGSTFAALRNYITKKGGNVVGATALGAAHRPGRGYGGHLAPTPENLARLKKFDNAEISSILKKYDLTLDSLSNGQLGILLRELDRSGLNGLRNSLAKRGRKPSR